MSRFYFPQNLLSYENAKTSKGEKLGVMTGILYLAPSDLSGVDLCPHASLGCRKACLFTAGRGRFESVYNARMNKTEYFLNDRLTFIAQLKREIENAKKRAQILGLKLAIRLNGTSDIAWELISTLIQKFSDVQFYDYTKSIARLRKKLPSNYDLTFSRSETNDAQCLEALRLGFRVAVVFDSLETAWNFSDKFEIIEGDSHDVRFLDKPGVIVALKSKGKAKHDQSGFVIQSRRA